MHIVDKVTVTSISMSRKATSRDLNANTKSKDSIYNARTNYHSGSTQLEDTDPANKKFLNIALKDSDPKLIEIEQVNEEEFH